MGGLAWLLGAGCSASADSRAMRSCAQVFGQDPSGGDSALPERVLGNLNFSAVAASHALTCGLLKGSGRAMCWVSCTCLLVTCMAPAGDGLPGRRTSRPLAPPACRAWAPQRWGWASCRHSCRRSPPRGLSSAITRSWRFALVAASPVGANSLAASTAGEFRSAGWLRGCPCHTWRHAERKAGRALALHSAHSYMLPALLLTCRCFKLLPAGAAALRLEPASCLIGMAMA